MGFGSGQAMAQGVTSHGGSYIVRGAMGKLKFGDEAGASACNRYGCSRALLLRPTENLLHAASPPWWSCKCTYCIQYLSETDDISLVQFNLSIIRIINT